MKILLDPQIFNQQTYGGISRYYTEIFSILSKKNDVEILLPIYSSENAYIKKTNLLEESKNLQRLYKTLSFFKISSRSLQRKNSDKLLETVFQNLDYDLFVPTYYDPYFLEKIGDKPFVLTVYDMIHELFPHFFEVDLFHVFERKQILLNKATRIIAVSHNTKKDILKVYPHIDPDIIKVIHHGSSIKIHPNVDVDLPANYILYVGARDDYKNFEFLLKSANLILKNDPSLVLIAAGGGKFNEEEIAFIKSLGLQKKVLQKSFEEEELGHFYQRAKCFVFPSLYEGFGIPVLESMACGCPIILSKHGSFPEVAGDAGIYFDTESEEDLREKLQMVLSDEKVRNLYAEKGLQQVKKYNWEDAAEQCLQLYKEAVDSNALENK